MLKKLVMMRHGESLWNKENRFTGWTDIELSEKGRNEAKNAGIILRNKNFNFDLAYTSVLKRAISTLWIVLNELNLVWIPVKKSWMLNERHYGSLQGLNKIETAQKYGEKKVNEWRRSFYVHPPVLEKDDSRFPGHDIKYKNLKPHELPIGESLEFTVNRVMPYWKKNIFPKIIQGHRILLVAHGNSIRAIYKILGLFNENNIVELNIPTAIPLVYEFNSRMEVINHYHLTN